MLWLTKVLLPRSCCDESRTFYILSPSNVWDNNVLCVQYCAQTEAKSRFTAPKTDLLSLFFSEKLKSDIWSPTSK